MSKAKNSKTLKPKLNGYFKMQILNLAVYMLAFLLLSVISLKSDVSSGYMMYFSLAFICISSLVSGFISGIKERKNGILCGLVNPLPFNIFLIFLSLFSNSFKPDINILYTMIAGTLSGVAGGIISVNIRLK